MVNIFKKIFNAVDVHKAGFNSSDGVVIGIEPFTKNVIRHDGPENILVVGPCRIGKGVGVVIPTCLSWKRSLFITDIKGESWAASAEWRKEALGQKVLKFDPMCADGTSAKWNPLAEIRFMTDYESSDVHDITAIISAVEGNKTPDYWNHSLSSLLVGSILHLMYSFRRENKNIPSLYDLAQLFHEPEKFMKKNLHEMRNYPHISLEEFLKEKNPFEKVYGNYKLDFSVFYDLFAYNGEKFFNNGGASDNEARNKFIEETQTISDFKAKVREFYQYCQEDPERLEWFKNELLSENVSDNGISLSSMLSHPKIISCVTEMLSKSEHELSSIVSLAADVLKLYMHPIIRNNLAASDFCINDLIDEKLSEPGVSLYYVLSPRDIYLLRPFSHLFLTLMFKRLTEHVPANPHKQNLLMLLDDFPQLGKNEIIERSLPICSVYGLKTCIIVHDLLQLNKLSTEDFSIVSNCGVQIYFTPNNLYCGDMTAAYIANTFKGITKEEILNMCFDKVLVVSSGFSSVCLDKMFYYKHELFLDRLHHKLINSDKITSILNFNDLIKRCNNG